MTITIRDMHERELDSVLALNNAAGSTILPLDMARMRALENGRPLIRSTNNGVSALVDHHGKILARGQQFTREVIRGEIQPTEGLTPFARFGSTTVLLLVVVMVLIVLSLRPRQVR